jgi:hypothetical protein
MSGNRKIESINEGVAPSRKEIYVACRLHGDPSKLWVRTRDSPVPDMVRSRSPCTWLDIPLPERGVLEMSGFLTKQELTLVAPFAPSSNTMSGPTFRSRDRYFTIVVGHWSNIQFYFLVLFPRLASSERVKAARRATRSGLRALTRSRRVREFSARKECQKWAVS